MARSMETSLRRLQMDSVDVLHVHNRFTATRGEVPDSLSAEDTLGPVLETPIERSSKRARPGLSAYRRWTTMCLR